jgi:hypothetical protein
MKFGITINLLLSIVLFNWLTCKQELSWASTVSLVFFGIYLSFFWLFFLLSQRCHRLAAKKTCSSPSAITGRNFVISSINKTLKAQLLECLQYGDMQKAEEISRKLALLSSLQRPEGPS